MPRSTPSHRHGRTTPEQAAIDDALARATLFTAVRFKGRGPAGQPQSYPYERGEHPSLKAALAAAAAHGDGRTMIYAVTPEGRTIHIRNA